MAKQQLIEIGSKVEWTDPYDDNNKLIGEIIDAVNYGKLIIYTVRVGDYHYQGNSRTVKRIDDDSM